MICEEIFQKILDFVEVFKYYQDTAYLEHCFSLGCGKTMLMDMFYEGIRISKKTRVHFNEFMIDVHKRMWYNQLNTFSLHCTEMETGDLVTFTEEFMNGKFNFLCSDVYEIC